jgi:hypothetical protein
VQFAFQFCDVLEAEVKNRRSQSCISAAIAKYFDEVSG